MEINRTTRRNAFTLIEMLCVMAIMTMIMAMAMASFMQWGRGAAMRSAITNVRANLVSARQWAITHRVRTHFTYGNCNTPNAVGLTGFFVVSSSADGVIGVTNYLPKNIAFTNGIPPVVGNLPDIVFKLDGSCEGVGTTNAITIVGQSATNGLVIYRLTGMPTTSM